LELKQQGTQQSVKKIMNRKNNQIGWSGRERATLIGVCVAGIMLTTDITSVGVALDKIAQELNASLAGLQWVMNAYNLTFGAFLLSAGSLADLLGRRRVFTVGIVLFITAALLCGFSQTPTMLILFRTLEGICAALVLPSGTASIAYEFRDDSERAKAFGILGSSFGIGLALGPLLGGALTSALSWRWIFLINVPAGLAVLALAVSRMRESSDPETTRVDWLGFFTFTLCLFLFVYALIGGPELGWGSLKIVGALLGAVVFVALFILVERLQRRSMFDLELFRKPTFIAAQLLPVVASFGFVAPLIYIPLYFQSVSGYSPLKAGLALLLLTVPVSVVPTLVGRLAAHLPLRILLSTGLVLVGLGCLGMSGLEVNGGRAALLSGLLVTGIGTGIVNGLMDNLAVSVVSSERSGMAAGIFNTMRVVGDATAIAGAGAILIALTRSRLLDLLWGTSVVARDTAAGFANQVARGEINNAAASVSSAGREVFIQAATQSYVSALSNLLIIIACISFIGAVLILALVRAGDFFSAPNSKPQSS
jgi:EmrB/QacA subfamily drug resistance transporter